MPTSHSLLVRLLIPLSLILLLATGCEKDEASTATAASTPEKVENGEKVEKTTAPSKSTVDCPTYTKELLDVCNNLVKKRIDGNCAYGMINIRDIHEEHGDDFMTQPGACHDALEELRSGLARKEGANTSEVAWHEGCPAHFASLKTRCFDAIATGTPDLHCSPRLLQLELSVRRGEDGSMACRMSLPTVQ
ncbi:MAG: hypothetical protein ACNA8W_21795 [Bradymonadaceae bacterium]